MLEVGRCQPCHTHGRRIVSGPPSRRRRRRRRHRSRPGSSWVTCGRELSGEAAAKNRCGRCAWVGAAATGARRSTGRRAGTGRCARSRLAAPSAWRAGEDPEPIRCGCAFKGASGLAHVACKARAAAHNGPGFNSAGEECSTRGQRSTGSMQIGLAPSHRAAAGAARAARSQPPPRAGESGRGAATCVQIRRGGGAAAGSAGGPPPGVWARRRGHRHHAG